MKDSLAKKIVKEKYSEIASLPILSSSSCCGSDITYDIATMKDDYSNVEGYFNEADLGLGCGIPTEFAEIKEGDFVLDLGSGAGNDVFIARRLTGATGKVIGLDMTEKMIEKANVNKTKLGYENVEFVLGDIEQMPFDDNLFDVVISNCVLNLVPDKAKAFSEIFRVLKHGGHFCISDIVIEGILPEKLYEVATLYVGCVSGALNQDSYLDIVKNLGFNNIQIRKEKLINIPDSVYLKYLDKSDLDEFKNRNVKIKSITLTAQK